MELAYSILAKATFAAILYGLVFLLASAQPLFGPSQSGPLLPMSPAEAALTAIVNIGLLLLPVLILFFFSFGYYGLAHKGSSSFTPEAWEFVWLARLWFRTFWALVGAGIIVFFVLVGASVAPVSDAVLLAVFCLWIAFPSALLIALVLFLGYAALAVLPVRRRFLLGPVLLADVVFVAGAAAGSIVLTARAWSAIRASDVLAPAYSPWTTIPSGAFNLGTLALLYLGFRWARRHPPVKQTPIAPPPPPLGSHSPSVLAGPDRPP